MQLTKKKKIIIACIAVAVIILLIVIIAIVTHKKKPVELKKYTDGEMTLVDTIGKDSGNAVDVYITKEQDLYLEIENSQYADFYLTEEKPPVYNVSTYFDLVTEKTYITVMFDKNIDSTVATQANVTYPCECELVFFSDAFGIEYTIKVQVDSDLGYISGSMKTKEVDNTIINEFLEPYGGISVPKGAVLLSAREDILEIDAPDVSDIIDVTLVEYVLDGIAREIYITDKENLELVSKRYYAPDIRTLNVNGVEAQVMSNSRAYFAYYVIGDYLHINTAFYISEESVDDNTLIEALKSYIK